MTDPALCTIDLLATRNQLGFGQPEMALALGLSPNEISEAERGGSQDVEGLAKPLPPRVNGKLIVFLSSHPLAIRSQGENCKTSIEPTIDGEVFRVTDVVQVSDHSAQRAIRITSVGRL